MQEGPSSTTIFVASPRGAFRQPALLLLAVVAVVGAVFGAADVHAEEALADGLSLVPIPLARPKVKDVDVDPKPLGGRCGQGSPPQVAERLPWGPGERLDFDITYVGIRTGRASVRIDERVESDGVVTYPVRAHARTDGFLAVFGDLDAAMISYVTPGTSLPVRMANHVVVREPFAPPGVIREDGAFARKSRGPNVVGGGRVSSRYDATVNGKHKRKFIKMSSRADVVDVLSVIPWLRSRAISEGDRFCVELFHRRRLYRAQGRVGPIETLKSEVGSRRAWRIDVDILHVKAKKPRHISIWMSADADRLPLSVKTAEAIGDIDVRLTKRIAGRPLVHHPRDVPTSSSADGISIGMPAVPSPVLPRPMPSQSVESAPDGVTAAPGNPSEPLPPGG